MLYEVITLRRDRIEGSGEVPIVAVQDPDQIAAGEPDPVITSYSIHYTKLYEGTSLHLTGCFERLAERAALRRSREKAKA